MSRVVVYGAGGNGREVAWVIQAQAAAGTADWELLGFLDDSPQIQGESVMGLAVLGTGQWLVGRSGVAVAMGIGHPRVRRNVARAVLETGAPLATAIHPSAVIAPSATIGPGCMIFAGAVVSQGATLGALVQASFNAVVHHDASVGDFACLMAQTALAGSVRVGEGCFVGIGASARQGVRIGDWTLVGAGAAVVADLPSYCVAMGVPAKPARFFEGPEQMPGF